MLFVQHGVSTKMRRRFATKVRFATLRGELDTQVVGYAGRLI
jgi:hypothetical protein